MKKIATTLAAIALSATAFAGDIGSDGFIKLANITGDSQYKNTQSQEVSYVNAGRHTHGSLLELKAVQNGMTKGQLRDLLGESPNYSSGFRGKQWQYAFNYKLGGMHHVCIVRLDFDGGNLVKHAFKHVNTNSIGDTVDVCAQEKPQTVPVIIREEVRVIEKGIKG